MGVLDGLWHFLNFFAPALGVGLLAALLTKGLWWSELKGVAWSRLAVWSVSSASAALLAGLVFTGRDGKMVTYGAMVLACALALWLVAFVAGRR